MQALNLRPEPVAPQIKSADSRTSQGVSRSSQDESSFEVALRKAQKELDESSSSDTKVETEQKSTQPTTEGKNETNSQENEQKFSVKEDLFSKENLLLDLEIVAESDVVVPNEDLGKFTVTLDKYLLNTEESLNLTENSEESLPINFETEKMELADLVLEKSVEISKIETFDVNSKLVTKDEKDFSEEKDITQELLFAVLTGQSEISQPVENQGLSTLAQEEVSS